MSVLMNTHANTSILVQTKEHVAMPARHHMHKRGGVALEGHRTNGLPDLCVHDDNFPWIDYKEVVLVCRGENDLPTVHLWNTVFPSVRESDRGVCVCVREREIH